MYMELKTIISTHYEQVIGSGTHPVFGIEIRQYMIIFKPMHIGQSKGNSCLAMRLVEFVCKMMK